MDKKEAIIERIKKLMRHAESAKEMGSLAEAETFAKKATELLLEYNLSEVEVKAAASKDDDAFKEWGYAEKISYADNQSGQRWKLELISVLTKHNLCSYTYNTGSKTFKVYGKMQNVDITVWMYNFLNIGLLRLAQESHVKLSPEEKRRYNRYAYLKDFLLGAVAGIDRQLDEQRRAHAQAAGLNQLMVVNKNALNQFLKKTAPNVRSVSMKSIAVGEGYGHGLKAGEKYSITRPLDKPVSSKAIAQPTKRLH